MTTTSPKADALFAAYQADKAVRPVPSDERTADELLEQIAASVERQCVGQHDSHMHSADEAGYEVLLDSCHVPVLVGPHQF